MKIRNKKTGEIIEGNCFTDIVKKLHERGDVLCYGSLLSVDLFTEYWEEIDSYEPKEPKLKDKEIRKAFRAWYKILPRLKDKRIVYNNGVLWVGVYSFDCGQYDILDVWLRSGEHYTIAELCGEEAPEPKEPSFIDLDERIKEKEEE